MEKLGQQQLEHALGRKQKPTRQQSDEEIGRSIFAWLKSAESMNGAGAGN